MWVRIQDIENVERKQNNNVGGGVVVVVNYKINNRNIYVQS